MAAERWVQWNAAQEPRSATPWSGSMCP